MQDEIIEPVNFRLKEILETQGLTVSQLAEKAGLKHNTVSMIVKNFSERMDKRTLGKLCTALKIQPGELFEKYSV